MGGRRRGPARKLLRAALLLMLPSCLVTSSPTFDQPEQTPPTLRGDEAIPDARSIVIIESGTRSKTFSAPVRSEEDLGQGIQVKLFIDYGIDSSDGLPYRAVVNGAKLPEGDAEDVRIAKVDWFPYGSSQAAVPAGCHTVTLMVSHAFDDVTSCPVSRADSSQITWQVFVCSETGPCPPTIDPTLDCPQLVKSCPENATDLAAGEAALEDADLF